MNHGDASPEKGVRRAATIATVAAVLITALVQFSGALIWGSRIDFRMASNERRHEELNREIDRIDERGSRNFPVLDQRLKIVEAIIASNTARLETLAQNSTYHAKELDRVVDQQRRIIEALDSTYNKTQESAVKLNELDGRLKLIFEYFKRTAQP